MPYSLTYLAALAVSMVTIDAGNEFGIEVIGVAGVRIQHPSQLDGVYSLGTAVLFITHDLGLAAERAQHIVVMYKGQVVESGPSLEVLQHPQHPYTKRLVAAAPSLASQRIISAKERGEDADALLDHHIAGESTLEKSEHIITVDHLTKDLPMFQMKLRRHSGER